MPTKRTKRTRQLREADVIRPSILRYMETGDEDVLRQDNGWLLVSLPLRELRTAYARGDLVAIRAILAGSPYSHNYFVRG